MIGDFVEIGCNSVLNPGSIVGRETIIYPLSMVRGFVPPTASIKGKGDCGQILTEAVPSGEEGCPVIIIGEKINSTLETVRPAMKPGMRRSSLTLPGVKAGPVPDILTSMPACSIKMKPKFYLG